MKYHPEDIIAIILACIVLIQMVVLAVARYNGIEIDAAANKEILLVIIGGLLGYIANKNQPTKQ